MIPPYRLVVVKEQKPVAGCRRFISVGLVFFCSVAVSIAVVEVYCMVRHRTQTPKQWFYEEEEVGRTMVYGLPFLGQLNSGGLRDSEYPLDHANYRVLAIGDSFTYGYKLKNSNSWPKKAQEYVRELGFADIEVLNGGLPDTDTARQFAFFAQHTYRYQPDLVIIGFLINDCTDLCSSCIASGIKKYSEESAAKAQWRFGLYAYNMLRIAYAKYALTRRTIHEYSAPYEQGVASFLRCKKAFHDFQELAERNNFKLVVVNYPVLLQLDESYPFGNIHRIMTQFFRESGIESYDLTPEFYGYRDTDLWVASDDSHPNRRANEIAAKKISKIIIKHYINKQR